MKLIDTHAHLFTKEFHDDLDQVVRRAKETGVEKVLLPNIDETTLSDLRSTVERYPDFFFPMMGLHPTSVTEDWKLQLIPIFEIFSQGDYRAVGEIGIDLYWDLHCKKHRFKCSKNNSDGASERPSGIDSFPACCESGDR